MNVDAPAAVTELPANIVQLLVTLIHVPAAKAHVLAGIFHISGTFPELPFWSIVWSTTDVDHLFKLQLAALSDAPAAEAVPPANITLLPCPGGHSGSAVFNFPTLDLIPELPIFGVPYYVDHLDKLQLCAILHYMYYVGYPLHFVWCSRLYITPSHCTTALCACSLFVVYLNV